MERIVWLYWGKGVHNERFATRWVYCMAVWVVVGDMVDHEELAVCSAEC